MRINSLPKDRKLGLLLHRVFKDFQIRHDMMMANHLFEGLRAPHSAITLHLADKPRRLSELAALNNMRPQSMLKLINELEALGYVERVEDPSDTRAKLVQFTEQGERMLAASTESAAEIYSHYDSILSSEEMNIDTLVDLMECLDNQITEQTST